MGKKLTYKEVKEYINGENGNGCKLISEDYINGKTKLEMLCKCENIFHKTWNKFTQGQKQCSVCGVNKSIDAKRIDKQEIFSYIKNNKCKFISDHDYKNTTDKLLLQCSCGESFKVSFRNFKFRNQTRCKRCSKSISNGENRILNFISNQNLSYICEYQIENCKNKKPLPFDFAIFSVENNLSCLIEFDGIQHYKSVAYFKNYSGLPTTKINDQIKNQYCKEYNIPLIRIPYYHFDYIEDILEYELTKLKLIYK